MLKRLYIHIGTGKTGTSAIQEFLDANNQLLEKKSDIKYADTFKQDHNHHGLCTNFNRSSDGKTEIFKRLEKLKHEIKNSACNNFIVSSEYFPGVTPEEIENVYLKSLSKEVELHIIVYLRRQDEYIESWYAQLVKTEDYRIDLDTLTKELFTKGLLDYYNMIHKWSSHIGSDNIHVKIYEKEQFVQGNIFNDFMSIFNINDITELTLPTKKVNPSLTPDQILIIKAFDKADLNHFLDDVIQKPYSFKNEEKGKFLSPKERKNILSKCEKSNAKVALEFLNRQDGKLFYNDLKNLPDDFEVIKYPKTEYLIRTFTHLLAKQQIHFTKEIESLKTEINKLKVEK